MRNKAKMVTYGILYGMGITALQKSLGKSITREEAIKLFESYKTAFPKLMKYRQKVLILPREKGYSETAFGRRRILSDINSNLSFIRSFAERIAINAPIQGTQADVYKTCNERYR